MRPNIVFGFLGTSLDAKGRPAQRWQSWRPSMGLCLQDDFTVHRLVLLHDRRSQSLFDQIKADLALASPATEVVSALIDLRNPWDFEEVYACLHDFAVAQVFEPEQENYYIHITTGSHVAQICWYLLAEARYIPAQLVQTAPPTRRAASAAVSGDPSDPWHATRGTIHLIDLDLSRYDKIAQRFAYTQAQTTSQLKSGISTRNAAFNDLISQIEHVAVRSKAPMLLCGPTGAGKSFLARRIFELKKHRHQLQGPFVEVNCATLRGDSAMSTLFGHVKGAYTGAVTERQGLLRSAHQGLLFLDEIGELGLDEQAMLLKAIEEKKFFPYGSDHEVVSDFQLIAGTVRDLQQWVAEGRFRDDLYARINLWLYTLPGLADRPEDIEPNLEFELTRYAQEHGKQVRFNRQARERYLAFATSPQARWRGNFRELSASVTRMATLAKAGRIDETVVTREIQRLQSQWHPAASTPTSTAPSHFPTDPEVLLQRYFGEQLAKIDRFDRLQLAQVIQTCQQTNSLSDAGRQLFQASRQLKTNPNDGDRLRKYLARFGLSWGELRSTVT